MILKQSTMIATVVLTLFACGGDRKGNSQPTGKMVYTHADTLIREAFYAKNYQRVLELADSLEQEGDFSSLCANNYRGDAYICLGEKTKAKEYYRRAVANSEPTVHDLWCYQEAGSSLARQLYLDNDYEGALRIAMTILANIDSLGTDNESNRIGLNALIGYCNQALGQPRQAKENYARAYQRVHQWYERDSSAMALLWAVETYNTISEKYLEAHEYDEAMKWAERTDSLMPALDKSFGSRFPEGVDTYHAALALIRARAAIGLCHKDEAERFYLDYNSTAQSQTIGGRICATNYLMAAQRYAEAADCYAEADKFMKQYYSDITLDHIQETYIPKLRANIYAGRKDTALYVARQITEFYDSALINYKRSAAAELATVYETQGKERLIAEQEAELLKQRLLGFTGVLLLVVAFFVIYDLYRRRARRRLSAAHAQLQRAYDQLEETTAAKERIESELRIARNIQMSMVPEIFPSDEDIDLYAEMTPAKAVGGDLYSYVMQGETLYFCVGDVSGKGVPASLFMAQSTRLFQTFAKEGMMPADIALRMNNELCEGNERNMFVTMFLGMLNLSTGQLVYCNCGHTPPVIDGEFLQMVYQNMPLGLWENYTFQEERIDDIHGCQLLLYTDGLNEAENAERQFLGNHRLLQLMANTTSLSSHEVIDMLTDAVTKFRNGAEPNDDFTLMCVRISASANC